MMNLKIDESLYKVRVESNHLVPVIIYGNKYSKMYKHLVHNNYSVTPLPFINAVGLKVKYSDIFNISKLECVKYITSVSCVSKSIHIAKNIIQIDKISSLKNNDKTITCAIIDTGVYPHINFALGKNKIKKFIDLINNNDTIYDDNGHGTYVAGIVTGRDIIYGGKFSGIDATSDIVMIKALDSNGETDSIKILEAMQWVLDHKDEYNIRVVCMSFGSVPLNTNDPLMLGAKILWDSGLVVVAAAGNSGSESGTIKAPGSESKIITVGAIDDGRGSGFTKISVADFSSRGPIFNRYKPDLVTSGVNVVSTGRFAIDKSYYVTMSGTSVSTPIVAGVALRLIKSNPNYTPDQIKHMLLTSTVSIDGDRNSEGFGMLRLDKLNIL